MRIYRKHKNNKNPFIEKFTKTRRKKKKTHSLYNRLKIFIQYLKTKIKNISKLHSVETIRYVLKKLRAIYRCWIVFLLVKSDNKCSLVFFCLKNDK